MADTIYSIVIGWFIPHCGVKVECFVGVAYIVYKLDCIPTRVVPESRRRFELFWDL